MADSVPRPGPRAPVLARREVFARCLARALGLGSLMGATVGAAECAKLLLHGAARYCDWALRLVGVGVASYAVLGGLLAALCAPVAWLLWRKPDHRAAPPSSCAALGSGLALAAMLAVPAIGLEQVLPAALAATLLCLTLRELLAWWPGFAAARTHAVLCAIALVIAGAAFAFGGRDIPHAAKVAVGAKSERPDVLLITIDTLRADHLGCYGDAGARTPNIDALAKESVLFEDATTQANVTGPSHTTMLTGLYPAEHGALRNGVPLSPQVVTLPELLAREGYRTGAFVSGFTLKNEACRLAPRFERYDDELIAWRWMPEVASRLRALKGLIQLCERCGRTVFRAKRPAEETVDAALEWMSRSSPGEPTFTWVHCYDPHAPYAPPAPFDRLHDPDYPGARAVDWYQLTTQQRRELIADPAALAHMRALYAGEISYADVQVGRLLERLRSAGKLERTLVILTSDHGEGLGDHGYYFDHGTFLYDDELRVPLLVRLPGAATSARRVAGQVRLLDLTPSVLEALGLPALEHASGSSLLANPASPADERPSFAKGDYEGKLSGYELAGQKLSLRTRGHKLIWTSDYWLDSVRIQETFEYYDLVQDPSERHNLWPDGADDAALLKDMRHNLDAWRELLAAIGRGGSEPIDPQVLEQLRKVGYW
jgi:choline-sulfatase